MPLIRMPDDPSADPRLVGRWLLLFAAMVVAMILVGGATRLTESGLSITEWKPVSGVVPPIGAAAWQAEFEKYQRIPQYERLNAGMTLDGFKAIYYWEYGHRLAARLVGLAFVLPFAWFLWRGILPRRARVVTTLLLVLLLGQAAMGWWMVKSGLTGRTEVSQYRLAAHLVTALVLLLLTVWTATGLLERRLPLERGAPRRRALVLFGMLVLVLGTAASGALVAGLRAGRIYNTFPLMAGRVAPPGYGSDASWLRSAFEDPATAQFHHRVLAIGTFLVIVGVWGWLRGTAGPRFARGLDAVFGLALLQVALGVVTLLLAVPMVLGVAHQGVATLLAIAVLHALHVNAASTPTDERAGAPDDQDAAVRSSGWRVAPLFPRGRSAASMTDRQ